MNADNVYDRGGHAGGDRHHDSPAAAACREPKVGRVRRPLSPGHHQQAAIQHEPVADAGRTPSSHRPRKSLRPRQDHMRIASPNTRGRDVCNLQIFSCGGTTCKYLRMLEILTPLMLLSTSIAYKILNLTILRQEGLFATFAIYAVYRFGLRLVFIVAYVVQRRSTPNRPSRSATSSPAQKQMQARQ